MKAFSNIMFVVQTELDELEHDEILGELGDVLYELTPQLRRTIEDQLTKVLNAHGLPETAMLVIDRN